VSDVGRPVWRKSQRCGNSACVEVATLVEEVLVRDSKVVGGPVLHYTHGEWMAFVAAVKAGEFDIDT